MDRHDYADLYAKGWAEADTTAAIQALSDDFVFHNPRVGEITKPQFENYFAELLRMVEAKRGGPLTTPFMEYEDQVVQDDGTTLTFWVWWKIPGTALEGAGLTKVTESGVVSHRVAYHAEPKW